MVCLGDVCEVLVTSISYALLALIIVTVLVDAVQCVGEILG